MLKILSTCATLSFLLVSSAMAQSGVGACAADIKKVCANIEPGNLRIATCVKEHVADLSDVCKARLAEVAAAGTQADKGSRGGGASDNSARVRNSATAFSS